MGSHQELQDHQTAIWVDSPGPNAEVRVRKDVPVPKPGADEVLVKMEFSGLW